MSNYTTEPTTNAHPRIPWLIAPWWICVGFEQQRRTCTRPGIPSVPGWLRARMCCPEPQHGTSPAAPQCRRALCWSSPLSQRAASPHQNHSACPEPAGAPQPPALSHSSSTPSLSSAARVTLGWALEMQWQGWLSPAAPTGELRIATVWVRRDPKEHPAQYGRDTFP